MRCVSAWLVLVAALVAAALSGPLAHASPAEDAEARIKKGIELRRLGRDKAALPEFQAAYATLKTPRAAAQLGLCEQALGQWTESADHLAEALEHRDDPWIAKNRQTLENSLAVARSKTGSVEVIGDPQGAEVLLSGKVVGHLPMPASITVDAGEVDVELRAPGYKPTTRVLNVSPGQYQKIVLRLERVASEPATPRNVPTARAPDAEVTAHATATAERDSGRETKLLSRWYFWAGVAAIAAGAVATAAVLSTGGGEPKPLPGNTNPDHTVLE